MIEKITFEQAKELLDTRPGSDLADVREEEEYLTGHGIGAVLLPVDSINAETAAAALPDKNAPVLLYCRTGRRSALAAERLAALGYRAIYDVGSLSGWPYGLEP